MPAPDDRDDEPADAAFRKALGQIAPLGMPFEQALIELRRGRFLRRAGRRAAAAEQLRRARDTFAALGALRALETAEPELLATGRGPRRRPGEAPWRLTPPERAVADLIVAGMTNREIAADLLLSVKTVEGHVSNVMPRSVCCSRRQLRAEARSTAQQTDHDSSNSTS